ncbi:MAG: methyltetrahydrofolate cobalamin methyltransferase, partial [Clostridia bacterium]|nr:methyltetrahydrofolate cobalamin methyltransferase [Clostridia bacterium]
MIIIGEKINGAIPSIKEAIANRDEALIRERVQVQLPAKPDFLDCAPATEPALEYDAMKWLIGIMEEETD